MRKDKVEKLTAQGWRIGSTSEFLNLSPDEAAYIEMKVALSRSLRERRRRQKLTQAELARRIRSSQSRVAKMEAGDPSVSLDLLVKSLLALGVTEKDLARSIAGSRRSA